MSSPCEVTKKGLRHYQIESKSEGHGGPVCTVSSTGSAPRHHVTVSTVRRKYGARIFVEGSCASNAGTNSVSFVVPGHSPDLKWTDDKLISTFSISFNVAEIHHVRSGQDNIHVTVYEQPTPYMSTKSQIDQRDVIFPIRAQ